VATGPNKRMAKRGKAQQRQQERATRPRKSTIAATTWHLVEQKLQQQWSPEQISGWLKKQHNLLVSHERIYQHVYADKWQGGLRLCTKTQNKGQIYTCLTS
jgi:transposase, IS30 family